LKTPLSPIVLILQVLNEGRGVNAVCRLFRASKNSPYRWQERLSDLKPTALMYALCHQFLTIQSMNIKPFSGYNSKITEALKHGDLTCSANPLIIR
jgi:hypothetical protein